MGRTEREAELADRLDVEFRLGVRHIRLDSQEALGRLIQDARSGRWWLSWRMDKDHGWTDERAELEQAEAEVAELWAVEELANRMVMHEEAVGRQF